jgi:uncharacterized coiled-coil protein SlyX
MLSTAQKRVAAAESKVTEQQQLINALQNIHWSDVLRHF